MVDTGHRDHHVTIFLPAEVAAPIEVLRREWDPDMAAQIAAHVTLAYPHEAPDVALLLERTEAAARAAAPFRLRLGGLGCFDRPEGGVFIDVRDMSGGYAALRLRLLAPPFHHSPAAPHVTVAHPRTSRRGRELWTGNAYRRTNAEFPVHELAITAFRGTRWDTIVRFPLAGASNTRLPA